MRLSPEEKETLATHDKHAREWTALRKEELSFWKKEIEKLKQLVPNGQLLDIGCGLGRFTEVFTQPGYDYTGCDYSEELLKIARENFPRQKFVHASLYELPLPNMSVFNAFWCGCVLLHLPKNRIENALTALRKSLKPEGIGFISLKEGEGEKMESIPGMKVDSKRLISCYQKEEFESLLTQASFQIIESYRKPHPGAERKWLCFFVTPSHDLPRISLSF